MRAWTALLCSAALFAGCTSRSAGEKSSVSAAHLDTKSGSGLVVSQVYGGAGAAGARYNRDFVELFNTTSVPIRLAGLAIHSAGPIGAFARAGKLPENAVVPPGGYYLVGFAAGEVGADLRPDAAAGARVNLLPVNGKIALVRDVAGDDLDIADAAVQDLGCGRPDGRCTSPRIVDLVGYGAASDYEGTAPAPAPLVANALFRKGDGCTDTGDSASDFEVAAPVPRSSASPVHVCPSASLGAAR